MVTLYYNPNCSKSMAVKKLLDSLNVKYDVIEYLKETLTYGMIQEILAKSDLSVHDIIRMKESVYEQFEGNSYSTQQWIQIICQNSILLQRPIIVFDDLAIIARSQDALEKIRGKISTQFA